MTTKEMKDFYIATLRKTAKEEGWRQSELVMAIADANKVVRQVKRKLARRENPE